MNTNKNQQSAEIQQNPEHKAQAAVVSHTQGHVSGHEQSQREQEQIRHESMIPAEHDPKQSLTHGKAASLEAEKNKH